MNLRGLPLAKQLGAVILMVSAMVFAALVIVLSSISNRSAVSQSEAEIQRRVDAIAISLGDILAAAQDTAKQRMDIYKKMLPGPITLSQDTAPAGDLPALPVLKAGTIALNNNLELLTKIRDLLNSDPAVMVRVDNKFIRVATFLKDQNGKLQIGVAIPPDGPETKMLNEGKTYFGLVNRSGVYYMSIFEPVFRDKEIIGAISIRVTIDEKS